MALEGDKLAKYNAQFQRSVASPLQETAAPKAPALDGAVVLDKYIGQDMTVARSMTGAEFYSMVGHIKRQEGPRGEALEQELMKITRQADKKIRLVDWVTQNIGGGVTAPSGCSTSTRALRHSSTSTRLTHCVRVRRGCGCCPPVRPPRVRRS